MFKKILAATAVSGVAALTLSACDGGGSSSPAAASPPGSVSPSLLNGDGGLWTGTVTSGHFAGNHLYGIAAKGGASKFWVYSGAEGASGMELAPGTLNVSDTEFTGSYLGLANGVSLANGKGTETGTITGEVDQSTGAITDGSFQSNDHGASQDTGDYSLTYDSTYSNKSSATTLLANGGLYTFNDHTAGVAVTGSLQFSANGKSDSITGTDDNNCTYTGTAAPVSTSYDVFAVTLVSSCASDVHLTGLAAYYASTSTIRMILDDGSSTGVEIVATQGS